MPVEWPEKITFMGVECERTDVSEERVSAGYKGAIKRGEEPWVAIAITGVVPAYDPPASPGVDRRPLWSVALQGAVICLSGEARSLLAIEGDFTEQLRAVTRDMEVLAQVESAAHLSMVPVLHRFASDWMQLPPLVRAGVAYRVFVDHQRHLDVVTREATNAIRQGFMRRGRVQNHFRSAYLAFLDLLGPLVKMADAEARAKGIDADTGPGVVLPDMPSLPSAGHQSEVLERASGAVVEEIDRAIARELEEQKP